ncbi:MAG TPA: hypothetical protein VNW94_20480, partial [Streptosporangiaceae bacterium]|nr:hypothetical protein [Streptosporangiaceae bacterium]
MKTTIAVAGALAMMACSLPAVPAQAADGQVKFVYDSPVINGDHVSWGWTLTNGSTQVAKQVTLTHQLSTAVTITKVSAPCVAAAAAVIRCTYGALDTGKSIRGSIEAALPADRSGGMEINGRVTWQARAKHTKGSRAWGPHTGGPHTGVSHTGGPHIGVSPTGVSP